MGYAQQYQKTALWLLWYQECQKVWRAWYERCQKAWLRKRLSCLAILALVGAVDLLACWKKLFEAIAQMPLSGQLGVAGVEQIGFYVAWGSTGFVISIFALCFFFSQE